MRYDANRIQQVSTKDSGQRTGRLWPSCYKDGVVTRAQSRTARDTPTNTLSALTQEKKIIPHRSTLHSSTRILPCPQLHRIFKAPEQYQSTTSYCTISKKCYQDDQAPAIQNTPCIRGGPHSLRCTPARRPRNTLGVKWEDPRGNAEALQLEAGAATRAG